MVVTKSENRSILAQNTSLQSAEITSACTEQLSTCDIKTSDFNDLKKYISEANSHLSFNSNWLKHALKGIRATAKNEPDQLQEVVSKIYSTLELYISINKERVFHFLDKIQAADRQIQLELSSINASDSLKNLSSYDLFHRSLEKSKLRALVITGHLE